MEDLKIGRMVLSPCQTNCFFVYKEEEKKAIVFDPGDKGDEIFEKLKANGISVSAIVLTHGHFDHIWGVEKLKELAKVKVYAMEEERELLKDPHINLSAQSGRACSIVSDIELKDGEELEIEGMKFKVIHTPGHTQGSGCFYFMDAGILISGDTLFDGSVGRTDFPTGSMSALVRSIKEKLFELPPETRVYTGHGGSTNIGSEIKYNPFCQ